MTLDDVYLYLNFKFASRIGPEFDYLPMLANFSSPLYLILCFTKNVSYSRDTDRLPSRLHATSYWSLDSASAAAPSFSARSFVALWCLAWANMTLRCDGQESGWSATAQQSIHRVGVRRRRHQGHGDPSTTQRSSMSPQRSLRLARVPSFAKTAQWWVFVLRCADLTMNGLLARSRRLPRILTR